MEVPGGVHAQSRPASYCWRNSIPPVFTVLQSVMRTTPFLERGARPGVVFVASPSDHSLPTWGHSAALASGSDAHIGPDDPSREPLDEWEHRDKQIAFCKGI
jgi:hypothetical protein